MNTARVGLVVVLLAVVAGGVFFFTDTITGFVGASDVNSVEEAYELARGTDLEVMKVEDKGSLDRIVMSDGENVISAHVTNDREYIVQNLVNLNNFTKTMKARESFVSCLEDQNAQFYGIIAGDNQQLQQHTRMAQLQIQVLGGQNGLQNIFRGPGTQGFPQQRVVDNGLVWRLNGELVNGLKTVPQLEDATGCTYDGPA